MAKITKATKNGLIKLFSIDKLVKKFKFLTKSNNIHKVLFLLGFLFVLFLIHKYFLSKEGFESQPQDLEETVASKKSMVLFHANWCGHCKKLMPEWDKLSNKWNDAQDNVQFIKVECGNPKENEEHKKIMEKYNIQGYPTIYVFENGKGREYTKSRQINEMEKEMGLVN